NASNDSVSASVPICIGLSPCPPPVTVPPGTTSTPAVYASQFGSGAFLFVPQRSVDDIDVVLRVQDTSRQSQTWGTSLPTVRPTAFKPLIRLPAVPTDSRFRVTLRIYGYSDQADPVRVRVFDPTSSALIVDVLRTLQAGTVPDRPSYLQLDPPGFSAAPGPSARIELSSAA